MTNILLAIYFILIAAIALFGLNVNATLLGLIELVIGICLLVAPYAIRTWDRSGLR